MPRARNIKPAFFKNDLLGEMPPIARILFIGLWTIADHKGNFEWRTKRIKAELLPYDDISCGDIDKIGINLDKSGFLRYYSSNKKTYCNIVNFVKHQNPHKNERAKPTVVPDYSDDMRQAVDFKGLKINLDKSRLKPSNSASDRADSCSLIPDSCSLIPDNNKLNGFDEFWSIYPRKAAVGKARAAYLKAIKKKYTHDEIMLGLRNQIEACHFNSDSTFICHASTWLNGERWKDEITQPKGIIYENGIPVGQFSAKPTSRAERHREALKKFEQEL